MYLHPDGHDLRIIGFTLGRLATGLSLMMAAPAMLALALQEWNSASALVVGAAIAFTIGQVTEWRLATRAPLTLAHGTVVVALGWLLGPVLAAVPLFLSGHLATFLDAWFEAMSGLTTSGLSVAQDLDHLAYSMSVYRHVTHFVGGQGIVIVVLALVTASGGNIGSLFSAEGRDERVLPSVVRTARFIFLVAGIYLAVGTVALTFAVWHAGITGWRAPYHALTLFFAAFDTGGFAPMSSSIGYYHSITVEAVLIVLMVAGALSFGLHYLLWHRRITDAARDSELRTLAVSTVLLLVVVVAGLAMAGTYGDASALTRKGVFTLVSAHSGTGFAVTNGQLFVSDWGVMAPAGIVIAMALGGMAGSTAGGVKAMRIGVTMRGVAQDVRRALLPAAALDVATYHSGRRRILRPQLVRSAVVVLLLYATLYLAGAFVGLLYGGTTIRDTLFESVSAAANVGLSVGLVGPDMPRGLQITYVLQMWLGRLEFMAVIASVAYVVAVVRGAARSHRPWHRRPSRGRRPVRWSLLVPVVCLGAIVAGSHLLVAIAPTEAVADPPQDVPPPSQEVASACTRGGLDHDVADLVRRRTTRAERTTSAAVVACPAAFDEAEIRYVGELVGDVLERDGGAWGQLNDDPYALGVGPLAAHRVHHGSNSGLAVWFPDGTADDLLHPGGPGVYGDVVEVTGTIRRADPTDGGGLTLRADEVRLLRPGSDVTEPLHVAQLVVAVLAACAGLLLWRLRRWSAARFGHGGSRSHGRARHVRR